MLYNADIYKVNVYIKPVDNNKKLRLEKSTNKAIKIIQKIKRKKTQENIFDTGKNLIDILILEANESNMYNGFLADGFLY